VSKRDIGKEILAGLDEIAAWRRGERMLKTTRVELPRAADVPTIRGRLGLSQEAFAACMGVSVGTLRNWEQGRREPQGPARALLLIADRKPRAFLEAVELARRARRSQRLTR
jgi:putative transcriptional regulator